MLSKLPKRITSKYVVGAVCWPWIAGLNKDGYGWVHYNGRARLAHRVVYEAALGKIPGELQLDHICRNRWCVNPQHLEPVTTQENSHRGASYRTSCKNGHTYTTNSYRLYRGARVCKVCDRLKHVGVSLARK